MGYQCGDIVRQKGNVVESTVLRRYVVKRERRYDLRDELGCVWKDVGEGELEEGFEMGGAGVLNMG